MCVTQSELDRHHQRHLAVQLPLQLPPVNYRVVAGRYAGEPEAFKTETTVKAGQVQQLPGLLQGPEKNKGRTVSLPGPPLDSKMFHLRPGRPGQHHLSRHLTAGVSLQFKHLAPGLLGWAGPGTAARQRGQHLGMSGLQSR